MKISAVILVVFMMTIGANAQFNKVWNSTAVSGNALSGFIPFQKQASGLWKSRLYVLDSTKLQVMQDGYSNVPQYTYNFTAGEILAGAQLYSLATDLTGDGFTEFYVISYNGTASNYRTSFKIINVVNNTTVFEANEANYSYSYPTLYDLNGDGLLEMVTYKYNYPYTGNIYFEVYNTNVTGVGNDNNSPVRFKLSQNYPNPFNPSTKIDFEISSTQHVKIAVYDILGSRVKTVLDDIVKAGNNTVIWNGTDSNNNVVPAGVYFYRLESEEGQAIKKMIFLK